MKKILQNRIIELGRGEEGVALVVTLAVFMFMYIFCAGVFAVGKMVKDRICLQNAADAAAYSAAVVQADTLSRIATINRAMSWTYAQMNKRRMDYIVYRWMEHAKQLYADDRVQAANWVKKSVGRKHHTIYHTKHQGYHGDMTLSRICINSEWRYEILAKDHEQTKPYTNWSCNELPYGCVEQAIAQAFSNYDKYVFTDRIYNSFYIDGGAKAGIERLEQQIDADMESIYLMNRYEKELIDGKYYDPSTSMNGRMTAAAVGILKANVDDFGTCSYVIKANDGKNDRGFLEVLENNEDNENRFLNWGNEDEIENREDLTFASDSNMLNAFFGVGAGAWFKSERDLSYGRRPEGFLWKYDQGLECYWSWSARYCQGCNRHWHVDRGSTYKTIGENKDQCRVLGSVLRGYNWKDEKTGKGRYRRDGWILDCRYNAGKGKSNLEGNNGGLPLRAKPYIVKKNFFGSDNSVYQNGTITVGIARPNANPWRSVLENKLSNIGLYHAFDPFLDWMVCFASARAGYKLCDDVPPYEKFLYNQKPRVFNKERDYCIDWKEPKKVIKGFGRFVWDPRLRRFVRLPIWDRPDWRHSWRQSWNLCQSDWDAVMIPVCRAASGAEEVTDYSRTYGDFREPRWGRIDQFYLWRILRLEPWQGPQGATTDSYYAGKRLPQAIPNVGYIDYEPGDLAGLVDQLPERYQGWYANRVWRGGTTAIKWPFQWRVSGYGKALDWVKLQKKMLH